MLQALLFYCGSQREDCRGGRLCSNGHNRSLSLLTYRMLGRPALISVQEGQLEDLCSNTLLGCSCVLATCSVSTPGVYFQFVVLTIPKYLPYLSLVLLLYLPFTRTLAFQICPTYFVLRVSESVRLVIKLYLLFAEGAKWLRLGCPLVS